MVLTGSVAAALPVDERTSRKWILLLAGSLAAALPVVETWKVEWVPGHGSVALQLPANRLGFSKQVLCRWTQIGAGAFPGDRGVWDASALHVVLRHHRLNSPK